METTRGKKGKKAGWQVTLRVKDVIFAGIGVVGLMMLSFALGTLAGRGDIYRAAYSWGLLNPEETRVAQWAPAPGPPALVPTPAASLATPSNPAALAPAPPAVTPGEIATAPPAPTPTAAKPTLPAPVTGAIAPLPPPSAVKKKGKTNTARTDPKSREEELRRVRQEMVQKLKFQNSFDKGPKPRLTKGKDRDQAKAQPALVRVARFGTAKEAQAKVAELQKKGVKANFKKTSDSKGVSYTVYKTSPAPASGEKLAHKPQKVATPPPKPKPE